MVHGSASKIRYAKGYDGLTMSRWAMDERSGLDMAGGGDGPPEGGGAMAATHRRGS
jgi:hypothetical protein